jgi:hypothetical protein
VLQLSRRDRPARSMQKTTIVFPECFMREIFSTATSGRSRTGRAARRIPPAMAGNVPRMNFGYARPLRSNSACGDQGAPYFSAITAMCGRHWAERQQNRHANPVGIHVEHGDALGLPAACRRLPSRPAACRARACSPLNRNLIESHRPCRQCCIVVRLAQAPSPATPESPQSDERCSP